MAGGEGVGRVKELAHADKELMQSGKSFISRLLDSPETRIESMLDQALMEVIDAAAPPNADR